MVADPFRDVIGSAAPAARSSYASVSEDAGVCSGYALSRFVSLVCAVLPST